MKVIRPLCENCQEPRGRSDDFRLGERELIDLSLPFFELSNDSCQGFCRVFSTHAFPDTYSQPRYRSIGKHRALPENPGPDPHSRHGTLTGERVVERERSRGQPSRARLETFYFRVFDVSLPSIRASANGYSFSIYVDYLLVGIYPRLVALCRYSAVNILEQ